MDQITREESLVRMRALGLPEVVVAAAEGQPVPEVLVWELRDPYELFVAGVQAAYPSGRMIPIFSSHTGDTIVGYRESGGTPGFMRFHLETPREYVQEGLSWDQVLVEVLMAIWERAPDDHTAESSVREAARLLNFGSLDRFLIACRTEVEGDYSAWLRALTASM